MTDSVKQALCCACGAVRTCRRPHNHRAENYWLSGPVYRDWHRETGDLKCSECGKITTHAIIHPERDSFRDHAERVTNIALGMPDPMANNPEVRERVRRAYRQRSYPSNPYVNHRWWRSDEDAARAAGEKWFTAMCGETMPLPTRKIAGRDITAMEAPTHVTDPDRADHENLDPDTGLWWTSDGECVNCLRVRNNWLLEQRRKDVSALLIKIVAMIDKVDARVVERLAELVTEAIPGGGA